MIDTLVYIQVRRLPVGDGIWIAHHKTLDSEYVLDFIVERKNVDDLRSSIRDNRYRDQKLRLLVLNPILSDRFCFFFKLFAPNEGKRICSLVIFLKSSNHIFHKKESWRVDATQKVHMQIIIT